MILEGKLLSAVKLMRQAAYIKRFHTVPLVGDNTVGQHTFGVVAILGAVVPPAALRPQLLLAAMLHDVPEAVAGDIPSPTKRSAPGLKEACDAFEARVLENAGIVDMGAHLLEHELIWLTLADSLEGWLFCIEQMEMGNRGRLLEAAENFRHYVKTRVVELSALSYMELHAEAARRAFIEIILDAGQRHTALMEG